MTHELRLTATSCALLLAAACSSTEGASESRSAISAEDPIEAVEATASHAKPGFHTEVVDGRLWVFHEGSDELASFLAGSEPAKSVTLVGAGPTGMTLRAVERSTLTEYLCTKPGFVTEVADLGGSEILWVFRAGSEALAQFHEVGEPAQSVTLIGAGPNGISLRGADRETLDAYLAAE